MAWMKSQDEPQESVEKDLAVSIWCLFLEAPERASAFEMHLARAALAAGIDQLADLELIRPNLVIAAKMYRGFV
jgi:hypothetical protein